MNYFTFDIKKAAIIVALFIIPMISLNTQQQPTETQWFAKPFSFISESINLAFFEFSSGVKKVTSTYLQLINITKDNQMLKDTNAELSARLSQMEEIIAENNRLNNLLDFKQRTKMELIAAKVITRDISSDHNTIRINKGKKHGLINGQAVITTEGVVGYIFRPEYLTSQVLLLTDRYSVVDGILQKSRSRGIVEGLGGNSCHMTYIDVPEKTEVNDLVVTSGLDNIFPKGLPVATVQQIGSKEHGFEFKVLLTPIVDPNKVEELFVITNAKNVDLAPELTELPNPTGSPTTAAAVGVDATNNTVKTEVKKNE